MLVTSAEYEQKCRKCFFCEKPEHISEDCRLKNTGNERHGSVAGKKGLSCKETGHVAKYCLKKGGTTNTDISHVSTAMVTVFVASPTMSLSDRNAGKWWLVSCCSKHMSNSRAHVFDFVELNGIVQVGN